MDVHNFPISLLASALSAYCEDQQINLNELDITALLLWVDDIFNSDVEYSQLVKILHNTIKFESKREIFDVYDGATFEEIEENGHDIIPLGHGRYLVVS